MFTEGRYEVQDAVKYIVLFGEFVLRKLTFSKRRFGELQNVAVAAAQGLHLTIVAAAAAPLLIWALEGKLADFEIAPIPAVGVLLLLQSVPGSGTCITMQPNGPGSGACSFAMPNCPMLKNLQICNAICSTRAFFHHKGGRRNSALSI